MNQQGSRRGDGRRRGGRGGRRYDEGRDESRPQQQAPAKQTLWQKITAFFTGGAKPKANGAPTRQYPKYEPRFEGGTGDDSRPPREDREPREPRAPRESRESRKPELLEVTSEKLYVGNLSFDAAESDLFDLFNGVGQVRNAEIVTFKESEKSKGFGFVTMATVDEAKRAVTELHDKEFLGRKLVVSGSKTSA